MRLYPSAWILITAAIPLLAQGNGETESILIWTRAPKSVRTRHSTRLYQTHEFRTLPLISARVFAKDLTSLRADPDIAFIAPNRQYFTSLLPAIPVAGIPPVWDAGYMGRDAAAAMIDTGAQASHPMFAGVNIVGKVFLRAGKTDPCFGDDASSSDDLQGHGTRTASIIAGQAVPQFPGYFGAARGLGTLYVLKAGFRSRPGDRACPVQDGILYSTDIFEALEYAALETPAKVVNLSFGAPADGDDDLLAKVADYFADVFGMTLVFSAGNSGNVAALNSPGIAYNGITVANLDDRGTEDASDDVIHPTSSRGPTPGFRRKPDLAAPGVRIYAADIASNGLNLATGTSASAPIVTGAAALLRDAGLRDPLAVKALLLNSTAQQSGWQRDSGWGSVNAVSAFEQRWNVSSGGVEPTGSQYFRGNLDGPARATLVWNRHVNTSSANARSPLNELSLQVFQKEGAALVARADGGRDNTASLNIPAAGDYIARVEAPAGSFALDRSREEFALSWTRGGMAPVAGPSLALSCAFANPVRVSSTLTITCTATNTGGLDLTSVTGTLLVPQGFRNGGPESFGNLAPGASRSSTWTIAVSVSPGSYELPLVATANSYGSAVEARNVPRLEVTSDAPPLALDPAFVELTLAASTAEVKTSGTVRNATALAPWLQASAAGSEGVRLNLTEQALGLAPGVYETEFIATAGDASTRGHVTLTIARAVPVVERARVTTGASMQAGCPQPDEASTISEAAMPQFWFIARGVFPADVMSVEWHSPSGLVQNVNLPGVAAAGDYCFAAGIDPQRLGAWRADLNWNGIRRASANFQVTRAARLAAATAENSMGCVSDARLLRICRTTGRLSRYEFVRPDGEVDGTAESANEVVEYAPVVPSAGDWTVRITADRFKVGSILIPVTSPVAIGEARIEDSRFQFSLSPVAPSIVEFIDPNGARTRIDLDATSDSVDLPQSAVQGRWKVRVTAGGVVVYSSTFLRMPQQITMASLPTTFGTLDAAARISLQLENAVEGDRVAIEFLHDAVVLAKAAVNPLPESGSWTISAALPIAGFIGAQQPGDWIARASINGIEIASMPLEIRRSTILSSSQNARLAPLSPSALTPLALKSEAIRP